MRRSTPASTSSPDPRTSEQPLAATSSDVLPRPLDGRLDPTPLPPTVAARRRARFRAAALATIPLLLFLVAAAPRVWAPDLVPYGPRQAAIAPLLEPYLGWIPEPVTAWVVVRGLLDALSVAVLYVALSRLLGRGPALLVALLAALNPITWATSRDPAGTLVYLPLALGLLVCGLVVRFSPLKGRLRLPVPRGWPRWLAGGIAVLLIGYAAATLTLDMINAEAADRAGPAFDPSDSTDRTLRSWQSLADTVLQTAARVGTYEVVALAGGESLDTAPMLDSLLRGRVGVRRLPPGIWALPLERETLFLVMPGMPLPVEMTRPSSRLAVVAPTGTDTGARLVSLRARPAVDWLARTDPVRDGRFADGSGIVGVALDRGEGGRQALTLVWELPLAAEGRTPGLRVRVTVSGGSTTEAALPSPNARRASELVVQRVADLTIPQASRGQSVSVSLLDAAGRPIPTTSGAGEVVVLAR